VRHSLLSQKTGNGRTSHSNAGVQHIPAQGDTAAISSLLDETLGNRLDSWKEIASYLDREVRTVQRWEKRESLPIHRHIHHKIGSIYAFKTEIDEWRKGRSLSPSTCLSTNADAQTLTGAPIRLAQKEIRLAAPRPARKTSSQWAKANSIPAIIYFGPEPFALPKELQSLRFGKLVAVGLSAGKRRVAGFAARPAGNSK
jgi:hypothetical protein